MCFFKQKLKEEREAKRAQLDGRHDYILSIVASCLGLEKSDVEDATLEGKQVTCIYTQGSLFSFYVVAIKLQEIGVEAFARLYGI